ncbi:MAG: 2,3-bisphosphoglycerate-dependent phosphoglycerate mutase [Gammaproteobacteria bacterium]|nr:2,3-bisphosphoglycerate-dependent phosphoglycerate mutase [Gammaproteobacteria bacterium]
MKTPHYQQTIPVVLIRHAQSQWNKENRFTGWADPPLTEAGVAEAEQAAELLRAAGLRFDAAYSSRLQRARQTLAVLLKTLHQSAIPQFEDWRLNERHYGLLQGLNKAQAAAEAGEAQVWRWRRGYVDKGQPLPRTDLSHAIHNPLYQDVDPASLPDVENLAETRTRVMAFWREQIAPRIQSGQRLLVSAHGNTLRALLMDLAGMSIDDVEAFEIPTATPIVYTFNRDAQPLAWRYLTTQQRPEAQSA